MSLESLLRGADTYAPLVEVAASSDIPAAELDLEIPSVIAGTIAMTLAHQC